jgi:hypothetical protein
VPYSRNLDEPLLVIEAVDNSVGSNNEFADISNAILRDNPANFGKVAQSLSFCDEAIAERFCAATAVA